MTLVRCSECSPSEPEYRIVPCPREGGFGAIGGHVYNIHVTAVTYACQCGAWMGRYSSYSPEDQKEVDPFGACPARPENILPKI